MHIIYIYIYIYIAIYWQTLGPGNLGCWIVTMSSWLRPHTLVVLNPNPSLGMERKKLASFFIQNSTLEFHHAIRWYCLCFAFLVGSEGLTIRGPQVMLIPVALSCLLSSTLWIRSQFKGQVCRKKASSELVLVRLDDRTDVDRVVSKPCVWSRTTNWCYRFWKMFMCQCTRTWRYLLWNSPMMTCWSVVRPFHNHIVKWSCTCAHQHTSVYVRIRQYCLEQEKQYRHPCASVFRPQNHRCLESPPR